MKALVTALGLCIFCGNLFAAENSRSTEGVNDQSEALPQLVQILASAPPVEGAKCGPHGSCKWIHYGGKFESYWQCKDYYGNSCDWK